MLIFIYSSDEGLTFSFNDESGLTNPIVTDEDFILADILERSTNESFSPPSNLINESPETNPSESTSLNNLILLNSQIYQSRTGENQ